MFSALSSVCAVVKEGISQDASLISQDASLCLAPPSSHLTLFHACGIGLWNLTAATHGFLDHSDRKDKLVPKRKRERYYLGTSHLVILTADGKISSKMLELLTFPGLA